MRRFVGGRVLTGLLLPSMLVLLLALTACSGGSSVQANLNNNSTATPSSMVQVNIGDGPSDRVTSFSVTINSISLTSDSGAVVQLLSSPTTVEITQLAGSTLPVATVTIPAGTYTKASISLGGAAVTMVDPVTGQASQRSLPALPPFTVTVNPPFVVSGAPLVLNLDLNLAASIAMDSAGNISFNPRFIISHGPLAGPGTATTPFNGGVDRIVGIVASVSGSSFTLKPPHAGARQLTFTTDSSTRFVNISGIGQIAAGMLVGVEARAQSDGTLLATAVALLNPVNTAISIMGHLTTVTGSPATQFQLVAHGMSGPGLALPVPGVAMTVNVTSATAFRFDSDRFDFSALGWTPSFSASTIKPGQRVEVDTTLPTVGGGGMMMGTPVAVTLTAEQVELEPQPLIGTVSAYSGGNTFTLTLSPDSAFATVAKTNTVTVSTQSKTTLTNLPAISNGSIVIVRGLLFVDGGAYKMVAGRIVATP